MKILAISILLLISSNCFAQNSETPKKTIVWRLDNLKKIGGHKVEVLGNPQIIKTNKGKAIFFDGIDDGIFINSNPIEGAKEVTIEAIFRPMKAAKKNSAGCILKIRKTLKAELYLKLAWSEKSGL